jgi:hypothetical protein
LSLRRACPLVSQHATIGFCRQQISSLLPSGSSKKQA